MMQPQGICLIKNKNKQRNKPQCELFIHTKGCIHCRDPQTHHHHNGEEALFFPRLRANVSGVCVLFMGMCAYVCVHACLHIPMSLLMFVHLQESVCIRAYHSWYMCIHLYIHNMCFVCIPVSPPHVCSHVGTGLQSS